MLFIFKLLPRWTTVFNKRKMKFLREIMNSDSSASFNFIIEKILFLKKEKASGKYLILARYLNHLKQKECKERGINFIDLSGNVYIAEDRIYIEKLQNKNLSPDNRKNRSRSEEHTS